MASREFLVKPKKMIITPHFNLYPQMEEIVSSKVRGEAPTFNEIADRFYVRYSIDIKEGHHVSLSDFTWKKLQ